MTDPAPISGSDVAAALAAADALARDVLARSTPLRFAPARNAGERHAAFRLRYLAIRERGWATSADYPDQAESDADDDGAIQLLGWNGEEPIATLRLIPPRPGRRLPTEAAFDLTVEPAGRVVDIGRLTVAAAYRDPRHRTVAALLAGAWLEMRTLGFAHACGAFAASPVVALYRRMGFVVTPLAPARRYWGEERTPIRFDVPGALPRLRGRWGGGPTP